MKILVFHSPFPQGTYKLNVAVADELESQGHEVYVLEQLNGQPASYEYIQQIIDMDFDLVYYEMLDHETFKIIEQLKCQRILIHASGGILIDYDKILEYKGRWYDKVLTSSKIMFEKFKKAGIPCQHYHYFNSAIKQEEMIRVPEYEHDCVFLGMGFNRLTDPQYKLERDLYFHEKNFDFHIYGNGWKGFKHWRGLLPPLDIGKLYSSAKSAIGIIAQVQREHGMINNRYTEMAVCGIPIITYNYETIDWYGAEKYLNFISSPHELSILVSNIKQHPEDYVDASNSLKTFMIQKDREFFERLNLLISQ
jgi:hypothetical protein